MSKKKKPVEKKAFEVMKLFDCQWNPGMPDDVKDIFFSHYECGNDVIVSWTVQGERFSTKENPIPHLADENSDYAQGKMKVDAWLIQHGAEPAKDSDSEGETVLIKYWW